MKIEDALRSGRRFKRPGQQWMTYKKDYATGREYLFREDGTYHIPDTQDIIHDDWILEQDETVKTSESWSFECRINEGFQLTHFTNKDMDTIRPLIGKTVRITAEVLRE